MKHLLILLTLLIPLFGKAQNHTSSNKSKFSVGANFSPNYSNYHMSEPDSKDFNGIDWNAAFGFNTGMSARFTLLKKWEIEIGIQYSRQAWGFKNLDIVTETIETIGTGNVQYRFNYIEAPLRVNYHFIDKKIFCYVTAGASFNQFLDAKTKVWNNYYSGEEEVVKEDLETIGYNKSVVALLGGFGVGYHFNNKLSLRFEPLFRYSLTPLLDGPIERHNYSIGGQFGLNFQV